MINAEGMTPIAANVASQHPHSFHIPVMGTGFTIDTPLRVARYGISSVISLVDDVLIEQMRKVHCGKESESYEPITDQDEDARAKRITAYLNLVDRIVGRQVEQLQGSPFEAGSEITRYYELLPESPLKESYNRMLAATDQGEKARMQDALRAQAVPGSIDVNIMTKLDRDMYRDGKKLPPEFADAMSALRGFANSTVRGALVLSAGMNRRLYNYLSQFGDFLPDENGELKKKITLKVSDFRSAMIQGRFLARHGLWVSEYRIESGLNCGGHAFATKGHLMGPILEEFTTNRGTFVADLHKTYAKTLAKTGRWVGEPHDVRITVQGGISTADEDWFMREHYDIDGTGWGTPFLLVPEVVNVEEDTLAKLAAATDEDIFLSEASPLGVPFWLLRNCQAEQARLSRIAEGKAGAKCPKRYLQSNTEFTDIPICVSSRAYVDRKLAHLSSQNLSPQQRSAMTETILARACLCHELSGSLVALHNIRPSAKALICPGPNIADFCEVVSLDGILDHIYGRAPVKTRPDAPHTFLRELAIYAEYLRNQLRLFGLELCDDTGQYFQEFKDNLLTGVTYYAQLARKAAGKLTESFAADLAVLRREIESISTPTLCEPVADGV
ncbi:MAG: hypothetical protein J7M14_05615 [Planctomycetes bacterium]|nr:hypothetical protein [Planctomycetota bacterium]